MKKAKAMITADAVCAIVKSIDLGKCCRDERLIGVSDVESTTIYFKKELERLGLIVLFKRDIIEQEKTDLFDDNEKSEYICFDGGSNETECFDVYNTKRNPGRWSKQHVHASWHVNRIKSTDEWVVVIGGVSTFEEVRSYCSDNDCYSLLGKKPDFMDDEGAYNLYWECVESCDTLGATTILSRTDLRLLLIGYCNKFESMQRVANTFRINVEKLRNSGLLEDLAQELSQCECAPDGFTKEQEGAYNEVLDKYIDKINNL